jgi:hypothetical protein
MRLAGLAGEKATYGDAMTTPEPHRRTRTATPDSAREAVEHFTNTPKGVRIDLRFYVYPRDRGNSVIVRDASGGEQTHIRIDKPTEAVVALTAIWEETAKLAQRKAGS